MSKKVLNTNLLNDLSAIAEPILVAPYRNATKELYGFLPRVSKKHYSLLQQLRRWLDAHEIDYDEYMYFVLKTWKRWCEQHQLKCVPVPVLCGDTAKRQYTNRVLNSETVRINTDIDDDLAKRIYIEILALQLFVTITNAEDWGTWKTLSDIRNDLASFMMGETFTLNDQLIKDVVSLLIALYGESVADFYKVHCV